MQQFHRSVSRVRTELRKSLASLAFFLPLVLLLASGQALAMKPLLQEGKTSVFQRVVTHPGARLYQGPEATAEAGREVRTFTVMYIYARQGERLQVGVNSNKADGWIDANLVTEWPQAITMLFTDRTGRDPVLFFKDHAALEQTCQAESVGGTVKSYLEALKNQKAGGLPVIASEPIDSQVAEKNFYLLPVLNIDTKYEGLRLLEVASIDPGQGGAPKPDLPKPAASEFKIGFAFVIDTTISMGPYIAQTTALIKHLYNELEKSPYAENMAFAVVAFRSSIKKTPKLEYTARVICDFTTVKDRARLEKALEQVSEATVSTHDINEDSFAGIKEAAESLSWKDYGSRIMLMLSDAGPLKAGDPTSLTGFSPEALADYLHERKIYLTCVHVKGGKNAKNHAYAAQAYRTLTMQSNNQASYIAIEARDQKQGAKAFHSAAKVLAKSYENLLRATATGQFLTQPKEPESPKQLSPEEEAERIAKSTGYAMQLQFFGNQKQSQAPQVVKAWIADADLAKLESAQGAPVLACEPAVLLTKKQLDNLYEQLKKLLEASEEAFLNGKTDLFAQIQSASAQMSRDPKQFSLNPEANLIENKLLDEVLLDLPYKSHISGMTQQDWENMSTGERQKLISWLKGLIARYRSYDSDNTHWECFEATNADDCVYRVPLKMLP
ncbi:MAG: VWA domain-containing protein [Desulfovibrio sp.]|nr:VWA domain-containing protein [Desulfovibrio sp.]